MEKFIAFITAAAAWLDSTSRAKVLLDKTAWLLIAPTVSALYAIDPAAAKTLMQWSLYGISLAGVAVVISRLIFPQINLSEHVASAQADKNVASGIIVAAVVAFVGMVMLALVLWAKA